MSNLPSMPLFIDSYVGNTWHLSDAEHGRYLMLLMVMWQQPNCQIPDDDEWLARRFKRSVDEVKRDIRPIINEFCKIEKNFIFQKRLLKEKTYVQKVIAQRKRAAKARWKKDNPPHANASISHAVCMPPRNAPTPTPTPTPNNNKKGKLVFVKKGTPAWDAHQSLRPHRPLPCKDYDIGGRYETGWFFPSEYPASWKENQH